MSAGPLRVCKRSGRLESFDAVRLGESVRAALRGSGGVEQAADAVADAAAAAARREAGAAGAVETAFLARFVAAALAEGGWPEAARGYQRYRQLHEALCGRVRVHARADGGEQGLPWDRQRLALSLLRDRSLESPLAWQIARRVERRLCLAEQRHVTARLVTALADNECRTLGLRGQSGGGDQVGPERRQLHAWLGAGCTPAGGDAAAAAESRAFDQRPTLGAEVLSRFAVDEVLSERQADAWRCGAFELLNLGDWTRPVQRFATPAAAESDEQFWRRLAGRAEAAAETVVLWPAERGYSTWTVEAPRWWPESASHLRLASGDLRLARAWSAQGLWVRVPWPDFHGAGAEERRKLAGHEQVLVCWLPPAAARQRWGGVAESWTLDAAAVINMFPAARAAGGKVIAFVQQVAAAAELACNSMQLLVRRAALTPRPSAALLPAGLPLALAMLLPGEQVASDRVRRLLLAIRAQFRQAARGAGLRLSDEFPPHPQGAGARLVARDGQPRWPAYPVGWNPLLEAPFPPPTAFEVAPWLEFPAAAVPLATPQARGGEPPKPFNPY